MRTIEINVECVCVSVILVTAGCAEIKGTKYSTTIAVVKFIYLLRFNSRQTINISYLWQNAFGFLNST